jgi:ABC-type multidrug transport system fused ATPase/permease subunit
LHQPAFLLLFFGALIFYAIAFTYAAMTTTRAVRRASAAQVDSNAVMTDIILNYETIKYFAAEPVAQARVGHTLVATEDRWVGFYRRYAYNGLGVATIFAAFLAVTIFYAAHKVQRGGMTVGTFILVNTYMLQIVKPVEMLGYAMQSFSQGLAFLEKLLELFRETPEPLAATSRSFSAPSAERNSAPADLRNANATKLAGADADPVAAAAHVGPLGGEIVFENVRLSYVQGRAVLNGVSFRVPAGTTLAIVGPSGAGKSTLVRLLIRLYEPDSGRILLDGVPIAKSAMDELRRAVAIVPQDTVLFNDTISYNIAFGRVGATHDDIVEAARLAHLHDFIATLPDGYNTRVGERGVKLSGGERQRIAIARAAIKRPRIYVFDEATSSLDTRTERDILRNLVEISRHTTTLIIAHRLSTVVHADQILFLEAGTIPERGTHAALLAAGGRYSALWHLQQRGSAAA